MRVVIVGAGIAGLAAAYALRRRAPMVEVIIVEAAARIGGKLATAEVGGVEVDVGAEAVLARVPEAVDLARAVGFGDELVHPATTAASLWLGHRLRPIPARTVLGVPADLAALARADVLSAPGLARLTVDLALPGRPLGGDVSVGRLVGTRLGREVVDRLVEPLLGGVYAGRADLLSLDATVPALAATARRHRSLLLAARAAVPPPTADQPVFATLSGGLGRLPEAVAAASGARIELGRPARELSRTPTGWRLVVGSARHPATLDADAVVVACPAAPAARLLRAAAPIAAADLAGIDYASVAIVTLAYAGGTRPLPGSGFLVPVSQGRLVKAATFTSSKWAHLAGPTTFVRVSIGRYGDPADLQRDDDELVRGAAAELAEAAGLPSEWVDARVTRWGGGLPQYAVGHRDRVARIRAALPLTVAVCGAAYDGIGVPACIRSAQIAVSSVLTGLHRRPGGEGD